MAVSQQPSLTPSVNIAMDWPHLPAFTLYIILTVSFYNPIVGNRASNVRIHSLTLTQFFSALF